MLAVAARQIMLVACQGKRLVGRTRLRGDLAVILCRVHVGLQYRQGRKSQPLALVVGAAQSLITSTGSWIIIMITWERGSRQPCTGPSLR